MTSTPHLIDNKDGNTLAHVLGVFLGATQQGDAKLVGRPDTVRIATAYFNPSGFAMVAEYLEPVEEVRLLLGADPAAGASARQELDETRQSFERRSVEVGLRHMEKALKRERDGLPFTRTSHRALRELVSALRAGNLEVRRYEKAFLHAKVYVATSANTESDNSDGVIVGSSNLTGAGLSRNLELNLRHHGQPIVSQAKRWFDDLWREGKPFDLAVVFEEAMPLRSPWEIFLRVLWHLYGSEIDEDAAVDKGLPLTSFQSHGVVRALRLLRKQGGVIVADEVGLGKTFVAGEILKFYLGRRQRALLICPAALRDSTWKRFLSRFQMHAECLSFEQLANERQLRDEHRPNADRVHLQCDVDEYQLVIVDEAHNYRNPNSSHRAGALRRLLSGKRRDLLLLTATPVNNSLWDLYHLLRYFLRQDACLADRGILSIRRVFNNAMCADPSSLNPDILYPIIDATTVKRTRRFVRKHYTNDMIKGPDGVERPIVFPDPSVISVRYKLGAMNPGLFDSVEQALDPDGADNISFARYIPDAFRLIKYPEDRDNGQMAVGLLRSGLLKRFESSVYAFRQTVRKIIAQHDTFLDVLEAGWVVTTAFLKEVSTADDDDFEEILRESKNKTDARYYDVRSLRTAVERDRRVLQVLLEQAEGIDPDQDPKLRALVDALGEIANQAEEEAFDHIDEAQKRKVLVFSFFEDTVAWIMDYMRATVGARPELAGYRDRIIAVSGSGDLAEASRMAAVQGFAPVSMEVFGGRDTDRYDLLISTDVLAEGVNLQQCRHIINFDLPWNPMRLVQRHGRIDRIGSPHNRVFLRTIFPVDRLDRLLNLVTRIENKIAMAAASVGVVAPIEGAVQGKQVFTETREEIERLMGEDSSLFDRGGTAGAAQTGEEYRQTLRKALKRDREGVVDLPWKIGSGMISGRRRGIFFCAVVGRESKHRRTYLRFIAADDSWKPSVGEEKIEREIGTCLRLIECTDETPFRISDELQDRIFDFWEVAKLDILEEWTRETDPINLQPAVRPLNERVAAFIRENLHQDVPESSVTKALDILASPWPRREENELRTWFENDQYQGRERSRYLIDQVMSTGLEATDPPQPLPPIDSEKIEVLCWLGIEPESVGHA